MKTRTFGLIVGTLVIAPMACRGQLVTVVAGPGICCDPKDGGPATSAFLSGAEAITLDKQGNLYIWETTGYRVRKVNTAGIISTVAGNNTTGYSGDGGSATSAQLSIPVPHGGLATDSKGNLYIADAGNSRVRKVDTNGIITTVAGNGQLAIPGTPLGNGKQATSVPLCTPSSVAVDAADNLYIGSSICFVVRKVDTSGIITTVAGKGQGGFSGDGGPAINATMLAPWAIGVDPTGNLYMVEENIGSRVRKVDTDGIITTIAGTGTPGFSGDGGPAISAQLFEADAVAFDTAGNVYIADTGNHRIRKIDKNGVINTVPGTFKRGDLDVAVDSAGHLYIASGATVYKVSPDAAPPPPNPTISGGGVVNGASFQRGIVPNSWATILGSNLSTTTTNWNNAIVNGQLPTTLGGVTVTIGGKPAYLYYVSPTQINLLVPDVGAGPVSVTVAVEGAANNAFTAVSASAHGPAFFLWPGSQAVATRQNFTLAAKAGTFAGATTIPAKPGDVIILWGTGFGPTTPAAPAGMVVPSDKTYSTSTAATVTINNIPAKVFGAALAPGFAGLYQVAIQVPASLADGDWPIVATIGGVGSPTNVVLSLKK